MFVRFIDGWHIEFDVYNVIARNWQDQKEIALGQTNLLLHITQDKMSYHLV